VVTYYGFGGKMPFTFRRTLKERHGSDWLELWIKESSSEYPQRPDC
jgi:hypothetical protein